MHVRCTLPWLLGPAAAICLFAGGAAAEETVLVFERLTKTLALQPAGAGGSILTDTTRTEVVVTLGDRRMVVYEPGDTWVYDFERRRVRRVDAREGTYSDWSLHAFVAFGEAELKSRLAMRREMMKARPASGPSVLDLESLFSMKAPGTRPGAGETIQDASRDGRVRVSINGRVAVDMIPTDTSFSAARSRTFNHFLAFRAHLHPEARRAVAASGRVPRVLFYRYRDFNDETQVQLRLVRLASSPDDNDPLAGARRHDIADPTHRELVARLEASRACSLRADWIAASRREEAAMLDSSHVIEAALARAERSIGGCEPDTAWPAALQAKARTDTTVAAIRAAVAARDSSRALRALEWLDRLNMAGIPKRYVIDLLRGRARIAAGQRDLGIYLMMGGMGGNPCMPGGWLELGKAFLADYQPVLAWLCFEAAERVAGGACGQPLALRAELERGLEQRHPDFFR